MHAQASSVRRGARWVAALTLLAGLGIVVLFRWGPSRSIGPEPQAEEVETAETTPGSSPQPGASARSVPPEIVQRAQRTAATTVSSLGPAAYEQAILGAELRRLLAMKSVGDPLMRDAASQVHGLFSARMKARTRGLGGEEPLDVQVDALPGTIPPDSARHPAWAMALQQEGSRHPTFLHDAHVEFRRLGLPESWDDYLTVFLLESVDEIEMLSSIAADAGPGLGDFPAAVTGEAQPVTSDSTLLAAWLHRQATLRVLRGMGVPVDSRFEHVLLNAGLGQSLAPLRYEP